jgi:hypothetical protein
MSDYVTKLRQLVGSMPIILVGSTWRSYGARRNA